MFTISVTHIKYVFVIFNNWASVILTLHKTDSIKCIMLMEMCISSINMNIYAIYIFALLTIFP